ncbi:MAG TPA: CerR family C-terminal domain-containing protein [Dongiaceae bacterium]|nr:CerR family C-terminal domain-containing protein [Dongiaceae bacterium]
MTGEHPSLDVTREKLIEAAGEVFAEVGFHNATVREICARAGTNIAAVNYYFGEKLGLYSEVLKSSILAQQADALVSSEVLASDARGALEALIREWLETLRAGGRSAWYPRIMAHEMAQPTLALDLVAEAMSVNYLRFRALVGKVIGHGPDDARTRMCVHSVVGQILHYMQARPMLARLWPDLILEDEEQRRAVADHIVEFSLTAMETLAHKRHDHAEESEE